MRISRFILFTALLALALQLSAQDPDRKHSVGLYQSFTDYNLNLLNNEAFKFDSSFSQSARIAYQRRLSRTWMLNTGFSSGFVNNQFLKETFIGRAYIVGLDVSVLLKLNNGRIIKENPLIAPFLSFGYRSDYVKKLKTLSENPWLAHNQYGAGFNIRLAPSTHLQVQAALDQKLQGDFSTNMQYRFGVTQSLGKRKEIQSIRNDDVYSQKQKIEQDSLAELLLSQSKTIEKLEIENTALRVGNGTQDPKNKIKDRELERQLAAADLRYRNDIEECNQKLKNAKNNSDTVYVYVSENDESSSVKKYQDIKDLTVPKDEERLAEIEKQKKNGTRGETRINELAEDKNYYIITISSPNRSTADAWLIKMKKDFDDARILIQPNGYFRVGVFAAKDRDLADSILYQVKQKGYNTAWISLE